MRSSNGKNSGDEITRAGVRQSGESFLAVAYLQSNRNQMHPKPFLKRILTQWWPVNSLPWLAAQGAKFNMFFGQFFGRGIIEAKSPEPAGGCNVERSRMRRAIH